MNHSQQCQSLSLEDYLDGTMTDIQSQVVETHLMDCASCRKRLESTAAGEEFWVSISSALGDDELDLNWFSFVQDAAACKPELLHVEDSSELPSRMVENYSRSAVLQSVRHLFSPTDDPRSMGRIGSFEILGLVGSGGMGVVLKALEPALDRIVAIKLLAPHLASHEEAKIRFSREAKAAAAVKHEGIIAIHGVSTHRDIPFLVMPYEAGPSLAQRVQRDGCLTIEETIRVAAQVARALSAAHASGLVHRDIKPSNILLAPGTERALVTDFGLALIADQQAITRSGMLSGTPQFMSPEQARGESVDSNSDLFSLASVMFFMLTGKPPVEGETTYGILRKIGESTMPRLSDRLPKVPEWLDELVARLHSPDPKQRLGRTQEVAEVLDRCVAYLRDPAQNRLPAHVLRRPKGVRQHRSAEMLTKSGSSWPAIVGAGLIVLLISIGIAMAFNQGKDHAQPIPFNSSASEKSNSEDQLDTQSELLNWDDGLDEKFNLIRQKLHSINNESDWR